MNCIKPKWAITEIDKITGKTKIYIKSNTTENINKNWKTEFSIQCRQCIGCKIQKSNEWATRIMNEIKGKPDNTNWFITLTYDTENINITEKGYMTIKNQDFTRFIKRLKNIWREKYKSNGIKYFVASEYGKKYKRPHFHIILMNCNIKDIRPIGVKSKNGHEHYWSWTIDNIWKKGLVDIGKVTYESARYVAQYTLKKRHATTDEFRKLKPNEMKVYKKMHHEIEKEKIRMSKSIGLSEFEKNWENWAKYDHILTTTNKGVIKRPLGEYYDKKLKEKDEKLYNEIKEKRKSKAITEIDNELIRKKIPYTRLLGDKQIKLNEQGKKIKKTL